MKTKINKKLKSLKELKSIVKEAKSNGKIVVLANGVFDIIHVGHIRYLESAKSLGDILIVAVNDDESTQRLKGNNRPVIPEDERVEVLSAINFVDYIMKFKDDSVDKIILTLKPNIHAKGRDYIKDNVPEKSSVESYGGSIAIVGDPKDHSSSEIIQRIKCI